MPNWRVVNNPPQPSASVFFHDLDTGNLYIRESRGYYICIAGRPEDIGGFFTKSYVEAGSGIRNIPAGKIVEFTT